MDMMQIRRMVTAQMGAGKSFVKGTFTCPDSDTTQVIDFGKTFNSYLFVVEMTEESKSALVASGTTSTISIGFVGVYPKRTINGVTIFANMVGQRYIASSDTQTSGSTSALTCANGSITGNVRGLTATNPQNYLIRGYSYNYIVVSLD